MLKRNLIVISIFALGLAMSVSTFGQDSGKQKNKKPGVSRQDSQNSNARRKQTPKPNTGFMDYTDQNSDFIKADKTKSVSAREAGSGRATGVRKPKPANNITADDDWEEPVKANKQNQRTTANSSPILGDITTKANRRKFDHIGNINGTANETTRNRKPKADKFAGTILEGDNIKRKQPRRKGKGKN